MNHTLTISGPTCRLRPITRFDAGFIIELRRDPVRTRFLHPIDPDLAAQAAYLDRYFSIPDDYYFVIERPASRPEGLIALYHVNLATRSGEVGRWVLRPGSAAAVESIWLLYRLAFEMLGLDEVYCRTVVENTAAISFHDSCGLRRRAFLPRFVEIRGRRHDGIEHVLTRSHWPQVAGRLAALLTAAA